MGYLGVVFLGRCGLEELGNFVFVGVRRWCFFDFFFEKYFREVLSSFGVLLCVLG